jgi:hypothetical protein
VVPGFHCSSLPGMPPSPTPGSPTSISRTSMPTSPSPNDHRLGTPVLPQSVPRGQSISWLHWFTYATACQVARPLYGSDRIAQPSGTFTSRLSTDWSPSPLLDITTTATGLLYWRDSHPLGWQLASLHGHSRPNWASALCPGYPGGDGDEDIPDRRLRADSVEKVKNRTTPKISQKVIFRRLRRCNTLQRRNEAPWSFF